MSKTKFVLSLMTVMLILTLTVGPVQAQADLPPELGELPDFSQFTIRDEANPLQDKTIGVDGNVVYPVSPVSEHVYTKTPKFYFTINFEADRYRVEIMNLFTAETTLLTGAGTCDGFYCYLQPTTALMNRGYNVMGGAYIWTVSYRKDGSWHGPSSPAAFGVLSSKFNSTFDFNRKGWIDIHDTWTLTPKGQLKTLGGAPGTYASVLHKDLVWNFDYSVTLKRKSSTYYNALIVWGNPDSLNSNGTWDDGIYVAYSNGGAYYVYCYKDDAFANIITATTSSAIKKYDWNTIRVVGNAPFLDFWINGKYIGWVNVDALGYTKDDGYLGITMAKDPAGSDALLVDQASMKADVFRTELEHDPAFNLGLNPSDEVAPELFPTLSLGDATGTR